MHSSLHLTLFCLLFIITLPPPSLCIPFSPQNNLTLLGDAHFKNNSISLTRTLNCLSPPPSPPPQSLSHTSPSLGAGRAFYVYPIRFLDPSTNTSASFSCHFSFTITPSPSCPFGDGLAFIITSTANSLNPSIGYMGLPQNPPRTQDSFFAVEFDTSFDPNLGDINGNHIGIDVNWVVSVASVDVTSRGVDLKSGKEMTAWIEYTDLDKLIRIWVGYSQVKPSRPVIVTQIDLSKQFKEFMHVGFSASNGQGSAAHIVDRWRFKTFGLLPSTMPMDTIQEDADCLICFPGDSGFGNENRFNNRHKDKRVLELALGFGGLAAFSISVISIGVVICVCMMRRNKKLKRKCNEGQICRFQGNRVPKRLSLTEIRSATKGFNQNRIIGEGASAVVYEASLPSCGPVAVKRFSQVHEAGSLCNPFNTEFGTMVGCLRHKNLVQLQGWCCERNELVLVYEYMPNGSLDKILHRRTNATKFLTWERRLNIILGVSSALTYLHEECERQIIHRDVKTCNIMLDAEFNAKLGDFGLAEVYEHSSRTRDATLPAGTMGYLAPEYVYSGVPTVKTDVYSFGVVVLEVASGRRPVDDDGTVVADWVWELWEKGMLIEAIDPKLIAGFDRREMERMLMVGLSCVHPNYEKRPTMKEAARMLRGEAPLPNLPARKPTVKIRSVLPEGSEEILKFGEDFDDTPWSTPRTHFSKY
ncbi:hypothetical protein RJ640_031000 [Escallonia rubra]|uniref:non-specific serine/threonine protein kinase n=1 Tax=Escallonia rubra TaxID=112253 RepID=A0AA88UQ19_9ASTE|nr:hypothetical protein RJ640_031000 [Escallonia rubra]